MSIGEHIERMIKIQMSAYPDDWAEKDKREAAIKHLKLEGSDNV